MFGRNTKKQLAELNERLIKLSEKIEADHNDLQGLKIHIETNSIVDKEVIDRIATLESRQHDLRAGLVRLAALDAASIPDFIDTPGLDT